MRLNLIKRINMLNIKYDSNYKNVVNKIIEEINEKLNEYIIFEGDILNDNGNLNFDYPQNIIERDNPARYKKPFHILNYDDMITLINEGNKNSPHKELLLNEDSNDYFYIQLVLEQSYMKDYESFNQYEKYYAFKMLKDIGLYIQKMNRGHNLYYFVGIKKEMIKSKGDTKMLNIRYQSEYKEIANEIIDEINSKLDTYIIYCDKLTESNDILDRPETVKQEIQEGLKTPQNDYASSKPYHILDYDNMKIRLKIIKAEARFKSETPEEYMYAILLIDQEIIKRSNRLNKIEKKLLQNYLNENGIYFEYIERNMSTLIGINKEKIE